MTIRCAQCGTPSLCPPSDDPPTLCTFCATTAYAERQGESMRLFEPAPTQIAGQLTL